MTSQIRASGETLALTISYLGGDFAGSQRQGARRTVQGELERALASMWEEETATTFAGRTDRGVHAVGQVVSLIDRRPDLADERIQMAINSRLPDDLSVIRVARKPETFHARYDARWREYRYRLWCGSRQPLVAETVAQRNAPLSLAEMALAARLLTGERDMAAFAGDGEGVPWSERQSAARGTVRNVSVCSVAAIRPWWNDLLPGELLEFRVIADGFLPKMVRNIVGALVEVGTGRRTPNWIAELLELRDRRAGGMTAPAHGLTLWRVGYDGEVPESEPWRPDTEIRRS